ncbi:N-acetylmuramoyl-L-alanine amidase-like domain-containing protein [Nocardia neocaledoniensis]|uniref:N-acetylmuramoyl-L-alanine amidase-like domain-containing protein n=1 Tax=Nocardia neocaledoniensis TaxID=236511 RepID=UPI003D796D0B
MRIIVPILLVLAAFLGATAPASSAPALDDVTSRKIDELLAVRAEAGGIDRGELLARLGARLLDTPYGANMLVGSATQPEQLVIDLRRVDCFTYLDYLEAASRSGDRDQFVANLLATRYVDSRVEFAQRKHFFTDWAATGRRAATDITATLSPAAVTTTKHLNAKADGGTYLPGIPVGGGRPPPPPHPPRPPRGGGPPRPPPRPPPPGPPPPPPKPPRPRAPGE